MRRLLLDTHVLLWWIAGDAALGRLAREAIDDPRSQVYVSPISLWEVAIKRARTPLKAPDDMAVAVDEAGFVQLPVTFGHAEQTAMLPSIHRDPFDRMLIAQAQVEGLVLVTSDHKIQRYDVETLVASR